MKDGRNDERMTLLHRCHYGGGCPVRSILNCNNCNTATQQGELTWRLTDNYTIINVLQKKKKKIFVPIRRPQSHGRTFAFETKGREYLIIETNSMSKGDELASANLSKKLEKSSLTY